MLARLARSSTAALRCRAVAAPALARAPLAPSFLLARRGLCSGADVEVPIPELGAESIVEGGILSIAKGVGDYIAAEELFAEIETGARKKKRPSHQPSARVSSLLVLFSFARR